MFCNVCGKETKSKQAMKRHQKRSKICKKVKTLPKVFGATGSIAIDEVSKYLGKVVNIEKNK